MSIQPEPTFTEAGEPMPDIPRLRKLVEWVEAEEGKPDDEREWSQALWLDTPGLQRGEDIVNEVGLPFDCGTKACVCGRLALEEGARIRMVRGVGTSFDGMHPEDYGREKLGLTVDEAEWLFHFENSAERVREAAESIAARVGERL